MPPSERKSPRTIEVDKKIVSDAHGMKKEDYTKFKKFVKKR